MMVLSALLVDKAQSAHPWANTVIKSPIPRRLAKPYWLEPNLSAGRQSTFAVTPDPLALGNQAQVGRIPTTPTNDNLPPLATMPASGAAHEYFCCSAKVFRAKFQGETCEEMSDMNTVVKNGGSTSTCEASVYICPKGAHGSIMKGCPIVQKDPPNVIDGLVCQILGTCWVVYCGALIVALKFSWVFASKFWWVRANAGTNFDLSTGQLSRWIPVGIGLRLIAWDACFDREFGSSIFFFDEKAA